MEIIRKDATITNTDDSGPGAFEVILSAPTKDRDGDTLLPDEWKQPLPEHITFDIDHGMDVASTVGSGTPRIDDNGNLVVSGTYSSLPRAQEVRTLVNEGHIRTTSVAFMTEKSQKDGKTVAVRELLNGAFVAVPSNREALVLSSKGMKAGARNSASDMEHIQTIHDNAAALGADCSGSKSFRQPESKSIAGSLEATQDRVRDALQDAYPDNYVWLRATMPDFVVFELTPVDSPDGETYKQSYTDDGSVVTLTGDAAPVDVAEVVTPDPDEAREDNSAAPKSAATAHAAATDNGTADEADALALRARSLTAYAAGFTSGD
ncbi:MAG TPA: hypothetical protein VFM86_15245 [Pedococcus sp.]|nr:hypothetical protein [Pedococcus sp.]